jgi:CBS domain-containing protein
MNGRSDSDDKTTLTPIARFLARLQPFDGLGSDTLECVAAAASEECFPAGAAILVEGGEPGLRLYVVRDGTVELAHKGLVVDILARGDVFGHPTLLTGEAPQFTARAREAATVLGIPAEEALRVLGRPEGARFMARTLRDRLAKAARTMRAMPDVRLRPVTSLVRSAPTFCEPDATIAGAAELMAREGLTALLVKGRDGLGIVTDVDLRDKVVAVRASGDAPVSTIMSQPVRTVDAGALAQEASIRMMEAGVNHLPVVGAGGAIVGIVSASSLMTLDALSPFALRSALLAAHTVDELVVAAEDLPKLFVDLVDAHLDAPALTRIITALNDAMTSRLLEITGQRLGAPPVAFSWLALGSAARTELTLASDQDTGLAYADTEDADVDEYFNALGRDVHDALGRCGFSPDSHGVVAANKDWRMPGSEWRRVFSDCLKGWDTDRLFRAAIGFDFRHVYGDLAIAPLLSDIVREAPGHARFLGGLAELGAEIPSPLGFRQRLTGPVDIKKSGLLPVQNLARFFAFANGVTASTTVDRLEAVEATGGRGSESAQVLREAFLSMAHLQLRHHANAIRDGRAPDNAIDTATLRPLTKAGLQEALRVVAAAQRKQARRPAI